MLRLLETIGGYIRIGLNYLEFAMIFPVITVICLIYYFRYYKRAAQPRLGTTEWITWEVNKPRMTFFSQRYPMEKSDILPLSLILALFTFLALFQLGDTVAPQSFYQFTRENNSITIELAVPEKLSNIMFYTGMWTGYYELELSEDGDVWNRQFTNEITGYDESPTPAMNQPHSHLFKWRYAVLNYDNPPVRYIRLTASRTPLELGELALYDSSGSIIPVYHISTDAVELFDEQELIPERPEYMNSMYFDEIYHGRTALEHLRNIRPYETTHPPLGKLIIAASINKFGMTPFGWRFIGAVFGVAMLLIMYVFLKNMFGKTAVALCGTLLLGFDFMRFTQTRIATIDTYGVFFILAAFFFMYRHITTDPDAPFRKSLPSLALSGISFGLGCASKWIVPYAGAGLAVIYTIRLFMLGKHYEDNSKKGFGIYLLKTILFSLLFFVVVPVVIYILSYIPYGLARDMTIQDGMLKDPEFYEIIWENQKSMFNYHGFLVATHPYSSWWYQWIVDGRPILYYSSSNGNMRSSFAAFGNPIVWWGGLFAMISMFYAAIKQRSGKALFIIIGYLSQLLPWVAVTRIVFIYHYFPSTLFLVLALSYVFDTLLSRGYGRYKQAVYGLTASAGVLFFLFYPALTGVYAPNWYFRYLLRWIPGAWPF
ncbi:MAG: phospholipid carrier-dependent glycosyltransferase [Oscillospiraceae bacterium]|nr:phospholipid carrier-dependent glycosyltransferase [Oscillospiraceae bacterium]